MLGGFLSRLWCMQAVLKASWWLEQHRLILASGTWSAQGNGFHLAELPVGSSAHPHGSVLGQNVCGPPLQQSQECSAEGGNPILCRYTMAAWKAGWRLRAAWLCMQPVSGSFISAALAPSCGQSASCARGGAGVGGRRL